VIEKSSRAGMKTGSSGVVKRARCVCNAFHTPLLEVISDRPLGDISGDFCVRRIESDPTENRRLPAWNISQTTPADRRPEGRRMESATP
jgi:hypothetical protein